MDYGYDQKEFGKRVKKEIGFENWKQNYFANKAKISKSKLSKILDGGTPLFLEDAYSIAQYLNCDFDYLLTGIPTNNELYPGFNKMFAELIDQLEKLFRKQYRYRQRGTWEFSYKYFYYSIKDKLDTNKEYSQADLARILGKDTSTFNRQLNSNIKSTSENIGRMSVEDALKVAAYFNCSLSDLTGYNMHHYDLSLLTELKKILETALQRVNEQIEMQLKK